MIREGFVSDCERRFRYRGRNSIIFIIVWDYNSLVEGWLRVWFWNLFYYKYFWIVWWLWVVGYNCLYIRYNSWLGFWRRDSFWIWYNYFVFKGLCFCFRWRNYFLYRFDWFLILVFCLDVFNSFSFRLWCYWDICCICLFFSFYFNVSFLMFVRRYLFGNRSIWDFNGNWWWYVVWVDLLFDLLGNIDIGWFYYRRWYVVWVDLLINLMVDVDFGWFYYFFYWYFYRIVKRRYFIWWCFFI